MALQSLPHSWWCEWSRLNRVRGGHTETYDRVRWWAVRECPLDPRCVAVCLWELPLEAAVNPDARYRLASAVALLERLLCPWLALWRPTEVRRVQARSQRRTGK